MSNNAACPRTPLILTRPRAASKAFLCPLPREVLDRLQPVFAPLIDIVPYAVDAPMGAHDTAIFTSANGVAHGPEGKGRLAYCVGHATTKAARARQWTATMSGQTADELVASLMQNPPDQRLIHLSGTHTRGNIPQRLSEAGIETLSLPVYDQVPIALSREAHGLLSGTGSVLVPLFSPRTATLFASNAPARNCASVIALSDAVAQALGSFCPADLSIAAAPNAEAMRDALLKRLSDISSG